MGVCFVIASVADGISVLSIQRAPTSFGLFIIFGGACLCAELLSQLRFVQLTSAALMAFLAPLHYGVVVMCSWDSTFVNAVGMWVGVLLFAIASGLYLSTRVEGFFAGGHHSDPLNESGDGELRGYIRLEDSN